MVTVCPVGCGRVRVIGRTAAGSDFGTLAVSQSVALLEQSVLLLLLCAVQFGGLFLVFGGLCTMLSSPAVVLHPYGLPVYPQAPPCYPGVVQGSQEAVPSAEAMPQTYPAQYPPPPPQPRLPPPYHPVHQHSGSQEYPLPALAEHGIQIYPPGQTHPDQTQNPDPAVPGLPPPSTRLEDVSQTNLSLQPQGPESDENNPAPKRLHVSNIPFRFRDPDLRQMFGQFGKISDVEIIFNERGSKGFGFVTFESNSDADRAREKLNGTIVEGRKIEVNNATARVVTKKPQPSVVNGWKINPMVGAVYAPDLYTVASIPYPVVAPALAYRGAHLRGRGRAVYSTIRAGTAASSPVPAYGSVLCQDGLYSTDVYGYTTYRVAQPQATAAAATTYSDGFGRVYTTDPYHHAVGPAYGVGAVASLYRGGYSRFTPY